VKRKEETDEQGPWGSLPVLLALATGAGRLSSSVAAQIQEMQERAAQVKQAIAQNKQAMAQYTWVEQVTISLEGQQTKREHFQVRLGPDGKPQKQSLDPAVRSAGTRETTEKAHRNLNKLCLIRPQLAGTSDQSTSPPEIRLLSSGFDLHCSKGRTHPVSGRD